MICQKCGNIAIIRTSWTMKNPGRRFYSCTKPRSSCGFIDWYDPPMCSRSVTIIPGLLRSKKIAEERACKLKWLLICSWIFFFIFFFSSEKNLIPNV